MNEPRFQAQLTEISQRRHTCEPPCLDFTCDSSPGQPSGRADSYSLIIFVQSSNWLIKILQPERWGSLARHSWSSNSKWKGEFSFFLKKPLKWISPCLRSCWKVPTTRGHQPTLDLPLLRESYSRFSVPLVETPSRVAFQAPLSMGFSRQEYWTGLPCPPPGDLPDAGIEPTFLMSPALAASFFTTSSIH